MDGPAKDGGQGPPAPRRQTFPILRAVIAALALAGGAATLAPGVAWPVDLVANLSAQVLGLTVLAAAALLLRRRWRTALACVVAASLHLPALLQPRAPSGTGPGVRILLFNPGPENTRSAEIRAGVLASGADIAVLSEPPPELVRNMPGAADVLAVYPGVAVRTIDPPQGVSWGILTCRWPLAPIEGGPNTHPGVLGRLVERPSGDGGPFAVIAVHPSSPRTRERWELGNRVVESAGSLASWLEARGIPVVIVGDLNSTPAGWRSRELHRLAGVRRAKPFFAPAGTFPRPMPWPLSLAIDDVLVSPGIGVRSWRAGGALEAWGTDHRPVEVELSVGSTPSGSAR